MSTTTAKHSGTTRKPVEYESRSASKQIDSTDLHGWDNRIRSRTDCDVALTNPSKSLAPSSPADQLDRVRRLTVNDAEIAMSHASTFYKHRERRPRPRFAALAVDQLDKIKLALSKAFEKTSNVFKPSVRSPHGKALYPNSQDSHKLSRRPSVSSFTSVASAPEYLLVKSLHRDVAPSPIGVNLSTSFCDFQAPVHRAMGPRASNMLSIRQAGCVRQSRNRPFPDKAHVSQARRCLPTVPQPSVIGRDSDLKTNFDSELTSVSNDNESTSTNSYLLHNECAQPTIDEPQHIMKNLMDDLAAIKGKIEFKSISSIEDAQRELEGLLRKMKSATLNVKSTEEEDMDVCPYSKRKEHMVEAAKEKDLESLTCSSETLKDPAKEPIDISEAINLRDDKPPAFESDSQILSIEGESFNNLLHSEPGTNTGEKGDDNIRENEPLRDGPQAKFLEIRSRFANAASPLNAARKLAKKAPPPPPSPPFNYACNDENVMEVIDH